MSSLLRFNAALTARNRPLTGDTKSSFVLDDHMGWLKCDGRALDKVAYNLLFQVVGFQFGGSGNTFNLPDLQGRVMGNTGFVTDQNSRTRTFAPGTSTGELDHKLTVNEMPAHNHNKLTVSPGANTTADGTTSVEENHTHGITDPGHSHTVSYYTPESTTTASILGHEVADNTTLTTSTNSAITDITIDAAGEHSHTISSNGGDQYHNNIQPTLFYGNTFIYCGIPIQGKYPFHTGRNPVLI